MQSALLRFVLRRIVHAVLLIFAAASAALLLVHLAPGDPFSAFGVDPAVAAVERQRLGFDRPFAAQYLEWLARSVTLDFGESVRFHRPVSALLAERAWSTALLGMTALIAALGLGLPAGIRTASAPRHWTSRVIRAASLLLVSVPPLVTALVLLLIAAKTGWFAAAGLGDSRDSFGSIVSTLRLLPLPTLALALPIAASLERVQSSAMSDALADPSVLAARARGISARRTIWVHAWRLSLRPVLGVLGVVAGSVLSGSFIVEIVMSWPGLGDLMYEALVSRDVYLAAGCAAAGAAFLAVSLVAADLALVAADPRTGEPA